MVPTKEDYCHQERDSIEKIKARQSVGRDDILRLTLPVGCRELEIDVTVTYQPAQASEATENALEEWYGICSDDPMLIDGKSVSDASDDDLAGVLD